MEPGPQTIGYFEALGVRPSLGRAFLSHEDSIPGAHPVAIVGDGVWRRRFAAAADVLGRTIRLNDIPLTVVGVAPAGFSGLTGDAEVWIPQAMAPAVYYPEQLTTPQHFLSVVGRLRPGVPRERARAEVEVVGRRAAAAARLALADPSAASVGAVQEDTADGTAAAGAGAASSQNDGVASQNDGAASQNDGAASQNDGVASGNPEVWTATLLPLDDARRAPGTVRAQLVLTGAVAFVLLIAVINLSGLLLARSTDRSRETAVRAALGAGRLRLARHALVEGATLGLLGGALGVLSAVWSVRLLGAVVPERLGGAPPRHADLAAFGEPAVDWRVIVFAAGVALAAGLAAGLIPALRATRGDLSRALKTGARGASAGVGSLRRPTVLSAAAVAQIACALVLLAGAAHLLQGFHRLRSVDPGFDIEGLVSFRISESLNRYGGDAAIPLIERVLARVQAVPGVRAATASFCTPFSGCSSTYLHIAGRPDPAELPLVGRHYVAPGHFRTLGVPLLRGRGLTPEDRAGRPRVAVINETAARRFWPGEDPIGKRVWFTSGGGFASPDSMTEIVGVVGDVVYGRPGDPIGPDFYTSFLQYALPATYVTVRAADDPLALAPALRRAVAAAEPGLPIYDVRTMRDRGSAALADERFAALALGIFAGLGLLLASVGVYGVMAYSVAQRRREIGIRLALGSTPHAVLRLIVGQGAALAAAGLAIGAGAAVGLSRALPTLISDVGALDPLLLAAAAPALLLVALLACYLPARSAARVDSVETLAAD